MLDPLDGFLKCANPTYRIPPLLPDGGIALDASNDELVSHFCRLPAGVDVVVTVNQATDRICQEEESQADPGYDCEDAYDGRLDDYVLHGICGVRWDQVKLFFLLQP